MAKKRKGKLQEFKQDPNNFNVGTKRGGELLKRSIEENGVGRSIVVAADGTIIAGNKTHQTLVDLGKDTKVTKIETDGSELIVVKREDIEDNQTEEFKRMALMDNLVGAENLKWEPAAMLKMITPEEVQEYNPRLAEKMKRLVPDASFEGGDTDIGEEFDYPDEEEESTHIAMVSLFLTTSNEPKFQEDVAKVMKATGTDNASDAVAAAINWSAKN